jgi:hypothetical protein
MNLSSKKLQKNIHFIYKMYPTKTMVMYQAHKTENK